MTRTGERLLWIAQPLVVSVALWLFIGGPSRSLTIPIAWGNDALFYLMQAKTTIDHGWWWTNPSLAAPSGYHALLFPQNANVDQVIVWLAGLATPDLFAAVNLAWFAMLMLAGLASGWCLRRLGVSTIGAWTGGVLFALCPFALSRNVQHFSLMPYLVPFAALAAARLASGADIDWTWRGSRVVLAAMLLLGFNAIYFAFFGAFLIAVGAVIGAARTRKPDRLLSGGTAIAAIVVATAINLLPSIRAWEREGRPNGVRHAASDSEIYGLKIRHLVSPLPNHWFPPFQAWTTSERRADFPVETENQLSRLGVVATVGFVVLLAVIFVPSIAGHEGDGDTIRGLSRLTLAAVFLSTIGGLGSIFSLLVAADIRSYNRITPFIAFFALAALALWIDRAVSGRTRTIVWAGVLVLGLADQSVAARPLVRMTKEIAADTRHVRVLVETLERRLPSGALVFELPLRPYPVDPGVANMGVYAHFKPYLVSHTLRWSYPALSPAQTRAQDALAQVAPADLPARLSALGFAAILVDRDGYEDNGAAVITALQTTHAPSIGATDRYLALDIRPEVAPQR